MPEPAKAVDSSGPSAGRSAAVVSFDVQAADFDRRAGLPAAAAPRIAAAVAALAPAGTGVVLDVGAGTGQIGEHLLRACGARACGTQGRGVGGWGTGGSCRYLGLDVSGPMLAVFRRKLGAAAPGGALVRADAGVRWPVATGKADLIFLSRAAHLLPVAVLVEETLRVASPAGAVVVFGCVRSEPGSLRAILRQEMRRLLAEHGGVEARRAGASQRRIAEALAERGAEVLPVATAASWAVRERASDALAAWRAKPGLAGRAVPPEVQGRVLSRLEDWIRMRYGGLDVERDTTERYELFPIRLPKASDAPTPGMKR